MKENVRLESIDIMKSEEINKVLDMVKKDKTLRSTFGGKRNTLLRFIYSDYIAYINYNKKRVGFVALVKSNHGDFYEIDMGVKEEYQGLGIGTEALKLLKVLVLKNNLNVEIQAENINYAAIKAISKNGFVLVRQDELYSYFTIGSKSIK